MAFQIGQYRYQGSGCYSVVTTSPEYREVSMGTGEEGSTSASFKDVMIVPDTAFISGRDYYFSINIPQDMNYDMEFNIKLIKQGQSSTSEYQFLKNVEIVRGGTGNNVYQVALYEKSNGSVAAMIPLAYRAGVSGTKDYLYYQQSTGAYYLCKGGTTYTRTYNYNDLSVIPSWREELGEKYGTFEMVFRPVESGFTAILLEMVRGAEDYNIQHSNGGEIEYGRVVDIDKLDGQIELFLLNNLVDSMNRNRTLSRIGVWSHSGLMMAVNGEEIQVGPSGYYELDTVEVESLGIVARDFHDMFTVDYEYNNEDEEEGA